MMRKTPMARAGFSPSSHKADIKSGKKKYRRCKVCKTPFSPLSGFITWCSPDCGYQLSQIALKKKAEAKAKAERAEDRKRKEELKPRKWWLAKAKKALHAFIRARDEGKPCISCGTPLLKLGRPGGDYDAGHFRSVGSAKHLEFVENNIHGQCKRCNDHLKGNYAMYEIGLIARFGADYVYALKSDQTPRHLTIDDLKAIEFTYKAKFKELQAAQAAMGE